MATTRKSTTKAATPRQPAAEGADVLYNGQDFDAYSNGRYLSSHSNSQDAWIAARRATFEAIEADSQSAAPVAVAPNICEDVCDREQFGRVLGTRYLLGECEVYFPLDAEQQPDVLMLEQSFSLDAFSALLPSLVALLNSPQVAEARARWEAQQQPARQKLAA